MPLVLNVNDREAVRYMVSQMLRASDFDVVEAVRGFEALALASARSPDAIVLDVRLPDIDGYDVCRRLKADPETAPIPVLLTSALLVAADDRVEGLDAGADAYLEQPFEARELSATVRALVRARAAERNAHGLATELAEAVRVRDEFLSIAAHELRTPLTSLQLQLESLAHFVHEELPEGASDRLQKKATTSLRQVGRLAVLIDDLLNVSRISQGCFTLSPEEMDLAVVAREVVDRFAAESLRVGSPLALSGPATLPMRGDRQRIDQVLTNLVSNALKYGCRKPVVVEIAAIGDDARVIVRDDGIGVAQADRERIFDRFERAVSARHYGGLGLGLFITRQIVEAHGGSIRVDSEPGRGATFVVDLPLGAVQAQKDGATP